jgi:hypothetical protein
MVGKPSHFVPPPAPRASILTLAGLAIVLAAIGATVAVAGQSAAGIAFVALAVVILATAVRHHHRKKQRS